MADRLFQKPKVYDPTMAERVPKEVNSKMQQMMDLGFDDIENTMGYHPEMEEKCGQLSDQLDRGHPLDAAHKKVKQLQEEMEKVKADEQRTSQKLQSFQQVLDPGCKMRVPTEEDAAEDHAELVQLHERWEKDTDDVAQLAAELAGKPFTGEELRTSSSMIRGCGWQRIMVRMNGVAPTDNVILASLGDHPPTE
eukprot:Skav233246  [mRNA]  locus=scaffold2786:115595:118009:- [translate_table: standard]